MTSHKVFFAKNQKKLLSTHNSTEIIDHIYDFYENTLLFMYKSLISINFLC
ncbi:hypothetical protein KL86DYS1_30004 [uncultured Dysgonomonas sp.]|uniref:Uncharacterized protein n=1 Tax=uncultured Dysgonomonas sp. TaxID=206096 RepID=A0A212JQ01_9BACT|nr:hypothetical protein KL86DYS1_30004 [uncultured Dysgonomonas sp.]